jgi:alkylated DNA repair dioxygenase AlkB
MHRGIEARRSQGAAQLVDPTHKQRRARHAGGVREQATEAAAAVAVNPDAAVERVQLDESSWVDVGRGWLTGATELFDALSERVNWQTSQLFRYDHWVEERRLGSFWRSGSGTPLPHPSLADITRALMRAYKVQFDGFGLMQYRDGRDGQAFHRDTDMRWLDDTVIAIVSLGAKRPWLLRPRTSRYDHSEGRGVTHDLAPGSGDLIVMGGRCQADWEHSVSYLTGQHVAPRISIQWRHAARRGKPFVGASYRAPLTYDKGR